MLSLRVGSLSRLVRTTGLLMVLCIGVLSALIPLHGDGFPRTHDGENHLGRIANYYLALREGQFPPRLAPSMMGGFGYPVFNFNYPLPNMLAVPMIAIGLDVQLSMKLMIFGFSIFGAIGWYYLGRRHGVTAGFVLAGLFLTSNFFYSTIFVRGVIGELAVVALIPHFFLSLSALRSSLLADRLNQNSGENMANWKLVYYWTTLVAFFLSHNLSVLMLTPVLVVVGLHSCWQLRGTLSGLSRLLLISLSATLTSIFFWIPAIFEQDLVGIRYVDLINFYADHFPTLAQLIYSVPSHGYSVIGPVDGMGLGMGLATVATLGLAVGALFFGKLKKDKLAVVLPLIGIFLSIMIMLPISLELWNSTSLLQLFQFPWRWLLLTFLSTLFLAIPLLRFRSARLLLLLVVIFQLIWISSTPRPERVNQDSNYYFSFAETSTVQHENKPNTFITESSTIAERFPVLEDGVETAVFSWTGSSRRYLVRSSKPHEVTEQTAFFPGWEVRVNGNKVPIEYQRTDGMITFDVPEGEIFIETRFTQNTPARQIGNGLGLVGIGFLVLILLLSMRSRKKSWLIPLAGVFTGWIGVLIFSTIISQHLPNFRPSYPYLFTELNRMNEFSLARWGGFDGVHYLRIANQGYEGTGLIQAFFPAFPALLGGVGKVMPSAISPLVLAMALNLFLTFMGGVGLYRMFGLRVVALVLLFPFSLFFLGAYAEALFFAVLVWIFYFSREKRYLLAGVLGIVLSATKVLGAPILAGLAIAVWWRERSKGSMVQARAAGSVLIGVVGLVAYSVYLYLTFGDPLLFVTVQDSFGVNRSSDLVLPLQTLYRYLQIFLTQPILSHAFYIAAVEFTAFWTGLLVGLGFLLNWLRDKGSSSWVSLWFGLTLLITVLVPSMTGTLQSIPRYLLPIFPVAVWISTRVRARPIILILLLVQLGLLAVHTIMFLHGIWVS